MKLTDAKTLFFDLRNRNRIEVCIDHIIGDHPERGYSFDEVVNLIKSAGYLQDTHDRKYLGVRFYWRTKDVLEHKVRLVIEFESDNLV